MNVYSRLLHGIYGGSVSLYLKLFIETQIWGREKIPPGPKIYAVNHISSHDGFWLAPVYTEPVHSVIGPGYQTWVGAKVLDAMESINAFVPDATDMVNQAADYLKKGDSVAIAPEGDIQETMKIGRIMPGVARIYFAAHVPIVPIVMLTPRRNLRENKKKRQVIDGHVFRMVNLLRGPFCFNIGEPWLPTYDGLSQSKQIIQLTRDLRERMVTLMEDLRTNKFWQ